MMTIYVHPIDLWVGASEVSMGEAVRCTTERAGRRPWLVVESGGMFAVSNVSMLAWMAAIMTDFWIKASKFLKTPLALFQTGFSQMELPHLFSIQAALMLYLCGTSQADKPSLILPRYHHKIETFTLLNFNSAPTLILPAP